jgi:biopolymer transport protein ExbD
MISNKPQNESVIKVKKSFRKLSMPQNLEESIVSEINITPLTDIFLVLLVIFMVTSSVMSQMGIKVNLPNSKQASSHTENSGVIVSVTSRGEIFVNGKVVFKNDLQKKIKQELDKSAQKIVILEGDKEAMLGQIVWIMDEAKKAGAEKFAVATSSSAENTK